MAITILPLFVVAPVEVIESSSQLKLVLQAAAVQLLVMGAVLTVWTIA